MDEVKLPKEGAEALYEALTKANDAVTKKDKEKDRVNKEIRDFVNGKSRR